MSIFAFGGPVPKELTLRITLKSGEHTELVSDLWRLDDQYSLRQFVTECKRLSNTITKLRPEIQAVEFFIMEYNMAYMVNFRTPEDNVPPTPDDDIRDIFPNAFE